MKRYLLVLLSAALLTGCVSAAPSLPVSNTEESLKNFLVGTWSGYVVRNMWLNTVHPDITLQIFEVRKNQKGWTVNAIINGEYPRSVDLYVQGYTIRLSVMSQGGGFYTLDSFGKDHLAGDLRYSSWTPHRVSLKKIITN